MKKSALLNGLSYFAGTKSEAGTKRWFCKESGFYNRPTQCDQKTSRQNQKTIQNKLEVDSSSSLKVSGKYLGLVLTRKHCLWEK